MRNTLELRCTDCGGRMRQKAVAQEFERAGLRVRLTGIPAAVCPRCGDTSFGPGVADKIATAANAVFEIAAERHKGLLVAEAG